MISPLSKTEPEPDTHSHDDFIEADYQQIDELLAAEEANSRDLQLLEITLEELISAQLLDDFYSKIYLKIDMGAGGGGEWRALRSIPTITDFLSEPQILTQKS